METLSCQKPRLGFLNMESIILKTLPSRQLNGGRLAAQLSSEDAAELIFNGLRLFHRL